MTRTREWTRLGLLVAATIVLAVGFTAAIRFPQETRAQERAPVLLPSTGAAVIPAAQPAKDLGDAFTAVANLVRQGVVYIEAVQGSQEGEGTPFDQFFRRPDNAPRTGRGSGFIISTNGYIITNNHVVEDADDITVRLLDRRSFKADVVGRDPNTDIAVIKIDAEDLNALALGSSRAVQIGEWVLAVGNPLGEAFSFTVTAGIVSGRGRRLGNLQNSDYSIHDFIQTDAAINPGNSGGPLVNIRGEVIGVNSAIASQTGFYTGYGFAVPIDLARMVADQIIDRGYVTRAVLGVSIADATWEDAEYVGLDSIFGVRVESMEDTSPARRAGIEIGDIIVAVDGHPALYTAQLQQDIGFRTPGDIVEVMVARRNGARETYQVQLDEADTEPPREVARAQPEERDRAAGIDAPELGVTVQEITRERLEREGLDEALAGMQILSVDPQGPSWNRLFRQEVITHIDGTRILSGDDLNRALRAIQPGDIFSVRTANLANGRVTTRVARIRAPR